MGCDDELTEVPHRFSWEGISFDHFLVKESLHNNVGFSSSTHILKLNTKVARLEASYFNLTFSIGQEMVSIGGVKFESLWQTTQWVR